MHVIIKVCDPPLRSSRNIARASSNWPPPEARKGSRMWWPMHWNSTSQLKAAGPARCGDSGAQGVHERDGSRRSVDSDPGNQGELAMIVADTDVLIDYLAGKGEADAVERLLRRGALRTTVISRFELLSGAKNPNQRARLVQLARGSAVAGVGRRRCRRRRRDSPIPGTIGQVHRDGRLPDCRHRERQRRRAADPKPPSF